MSSLTSEPLPSWLRVAWQQGAKAAAAAGVVARTPGSAAAKVASALRRHSGLSLLGWGRAADATPVQPTTST